MRFKSGPAWKTVTTIVYQPQTRWWSVPLVWVTDSVSRSAVGRVMSSNTFLPPLSGSSNNLDGAVA